MFRKVFAFAVLVCTALTVGFLSPAAAAADVANPTAIAAPTAPATADDDVTIMSSPTCSTTEGWGKIKYQVCFRYNCDAVSCLKLGYLGVINTATSARTVNWELWAADTYNDWRVDDRGAVTLQAGQQQTIFADLSIRTACDINAFEALTIQYDSAGWSPYLYANDFMACV